MSHFRTITAVVKVQDDSDLRCPSYAVERASEALEAHGFTVARIRNAHNETGDLPAEVNR